MVPVWVTVLTGLGAGVLGSLFTNLIQLWGNHLTHEHMVNDARRERIRQEHVSIQEAIDTFLNTAISIKALIDIERRPNKEILAHKTAQLRDALGKVDKARAALRVEQSGKEVIPHNVREGLEKYIAMMEHFYSHFIDKKVVAQFQADSIETIEELRILRAALPKQHAEL